MKTNFRILLIDDTADVLTRLKAILDTEIKAGLKQVKITVETLHVTLDQTAPGSTSYKIADQVITNLGVLCQSKFDYIFSDFGFIGDKQGAEQIRNTLLNAQPFIGVQQSDITGIVFQLKDIVIKYKEMCTRQAIPEVPQNSIRQNFIEHRGDILIYTNSPKPFDNYFYPNEMPIRKNEVNDYFQRASNVEYILMHDEFSITPEIEALFGNDIESRKKFYSLLLSKRINSLMRRVVLEHIINLQSKLAISKTGKAYKVLTAWAIGFGAAVAVFGEVIYHFIKKTIELATKSLGIEFDENIWINLAVSGFLVWLCWFIFSKLGLTFSKKIEKEIDDITQ